MENTQNWDILLELFAALRIPAFCLSAEELSKNRIRFDFGLRGLFLPAFAYPSFFAALLTECQPGTLSRYCDRFQLHYFLLGLPESPQNGANVPESAAGAARWVWVGPYATAPCTPETLIERAGFYPSAPIQAPLEVFCQTIPLVAQEDFLFAAMEALANRVFGGPDCYLDRTLTLDDLPDTTPAERELLEFTPRAPAADTASPAASEKDAPLAAMRMLEDRYATENRLLEAVAHGLVNQALAALAVLDSYHYERRVSDAVRNTKNYAIILNTLLRKAAESGGVHPFYLNRTSSGFARGIEQSGSRAALQKLRQQMVRRYALLARDANLQHYSLPIRQAILLIDADLSADLSLSSLARQLSLNRSYLSKLFHVETNEPLTDFVNRRRVAYAGMLLKTTSLSVQAIAASCGFLDADYFSRVFRQSTGQSPRKFRAGCRSAPAASNPVSTDPA